MATGLDVLQRVPVGIAVAVGTDKVAGIVAGARARHYNRLVTDVATASALLGAVPAPDSPAPDSPAPDSPGSDGPTRDVAG